MSNTIIVGNETMSIYEFARWASLFEAVELIANKCAERNIDFDSPEGLKYIKPLDMQDYVNTRVDSMVTTIERSMEFERNSVQMKIDSIKRSLRNYSRGDVGIPM